MANTKEPKKLIIVDGESKYSLDLSNSGGGGSAELPIIEGGLDTGGVGGIGRLYFYNTIENFYDFTDKNIVNFILKIGEIRDVELFTFYRVKESDEEGYVYLFVFGSDICIVSITNMTDFERGITFNKVSGGGSTVDLSDYVKKSELTTYAKKTDLPTPQTGESGTDKNYVWSENSGFYKRVLSDVDISQGSEDTLQFYFKYWGGNSAVVKGITKSAMASPGKAGFMRGDDKTKLDSLPSIWKGTQTQYDALGTYDKDTLYFVVKED